MDSAKLRKILSIVVGVVLIIIFLYNSGLFGGKDEPAGQESQYQENAGQSASNGQNNDSEEQSGSQGQTGQTDESSQAYVQYRFRNNKLLTQHYEKHGIEMGFDSKESYEQAASDVINNPAALHKLEGEDGDYVYYVEETNEFVILSTDGYIRTYFLPSAGKAYYDRQ